jgi:hypothetical protein
MGVVNVHVLAKLVEIMISVATLMTVNVVLAISVSFEQVTGES